MIYVPGSKAKEFILLNRSANLKPVTVENASIHVAIKPLYYLSRAVFLWPYKYHNNNLIVQLNLKDKLIGYILAFIFLLYYFWTTYTVLQHSSHRTMPLTIADLVFKLLMHCFGIFSVLVQNLNCGEQTELFVKECESFGKYKMIFPVTSMWQRLRFKFLVQLIVMIPIFILQAILGPVYALSNFTPVMHLHYLSIYTIQYFMVLDFLKINFKVEILRTCLVSLNEKFESSSVDDDHCSTCTIWTATEPKIGEIRLLRRLHGRLCKLIEECNDMHGWQVFLLISAISSMVLFSLYNNLEAATTNSSSQRSNLLTWGSEVLHLSFYCCILVMLVSGCSAMKKQAQKTGILASNILIEINVDKANKLMQMYKEELQLLIDQIAFRKPTFSAAGLLNVDYTTVSTITGVITTYLIVYLQFRDAPACVCTVNGTIA